VRIVVKSISSGVVLLLVVTLLFPLFFQTVRTSETLSVKADSATKRKAAFTQLWNFEVQTSENSVSSPVLANGLLYVTAGNSGGYKTSLYCLNTSSGTQVWNHTECYLRFSVANGYIYFNEIPESNLYTNKGITACLNAYTGSQIWSYTYGLSKCAPIVIGNRVYVSVYAAPHSDSDHGFVYSLDAFTGDVIWNQTINSAVYHVTVTNGKVFVNFIKQNYLDGLFYAEGICAFNASTGERIWNCPAGDSLNKVPSAPPRVFDNKVYVGYSNYSKTDPNYHAGGVYALDASNGEPLWNFKTSDATGNPLVANGICYVLSGDSILNALDASDGTAVWNYTAETNLGSLQLFNGYLLAGSSLGAYCFDASNGTLIWNFAADDYGDSSPTRPVYADDVVYVGWNGHRSLLSVTQHNFYALDALSGEKIGNYTLGYAVGESPTVMNNTIYIGADAVTESRIDFVGPSAIIALNSTITPSPPPSTLLSTLAVTLIAIVSIVAIATLLIYFKKRKH
jgi:outer membrane protein assembly factor BamB